MPRRDEGMVDFGLRVTGIWLASIAVAAALDLALVVVMLFIIPFYAVGGALKVAPTVLGIVSLAEDIGIVDTLPEWVTPARWALAPIGLAQDIGAVSHLLEWGQDAVQRIDWWKAGALLISGASVGFRWLWKRLRD